MTRQEAVLVFGSAQELCKFLGLCGVHAVYNWKPDQRIPAKHELRIREHMERKTTRKVARA
jgi:hypothetical protein